MRQCVAEWRELWAHRDLLWVMTRRELAVRYAGSMAGVLWAYIQPLLTIGAYFLVFDIVFAMRMGDSAPASRVGIYLVVGSLPWLAFCESLSRGTSSLIDAGGLLQKNALPTVLFIMILIVVELLPYPNLTDILTALSFQIFYPDQRTNKFAAESCGSDKHHSIVVSFGSCKTKS